MNTKTCSKCGWVFPETYTSRKCKWCGGYIPNGYCRECGEWSDNLIPQYNMCRPCLRKREIAKHTARYYKHIEEDELRYKAWVERTSALPYKALTQEQWEQTINHFGGCALCGAEEISSKAFFIPFKEGGKYTAWNIIPICEVCAKNVQYNMFSFMDSRADRRKPKDAYKRLGIITSYLEERIKEVEQET